MHRVWGEGGWRWAEENAKVFSKSRLPEVADGNYEYDHRLCITVPRIFSRDYNSNEINVFEEPIATVHQNAVRLRTAKTIRYRIIRVGGGGGFSLLCLTAIKQCWIDVLTC